MALVLHILFQVSRGNTSVVLSLLTYKAATNNLRAVLEIAASTADNVLPPKLRLPCHMILYERNPNFFGRQDSLNEMDSYLCPHDTHLDSSAYPSELKTYAICGPGGMGKTQLAAEFALTHANVFDVVLWMRADTHAKLDADFNAAAVELGLVEEGSTDAKDLAVTRELLKGWLNRPFRVHQESDNASTNHASWLLVFDNADTREVLADFWPIDGSVGSVLITSRDPLARTQSYRVERGVNLLPFSEDDSADLLLQLTERQDEGDRVTAAAVGQKLAGFPLAIAQMAGLILRQELSFTEFLQRYEEEHEHHNLFEFRFEPRPGAIVYEHTIATVFSLENLTKGVALLEVLSMMDSDVCEDVLEPSLNDKRLAGFPKNATEYQQARYELLGSSLITRNRKTKTLSINHMVQDAACARMSSYRFVPVFRHAVRLLTRQWPGSGYNLRQDNRRWKQCEMLSPHALRLKDRFSKQAAMVQDSLALSRKFASLLNEVGG